MSDERLDPAEAELQQWIDGLLESPTAAAPVALRGEILRSIRRKQRRSLATKSLVAAAATILVVFLSLQKTPVSVDRPVVSLPNTIASSTNPITTPEIPPATSPIAAPTAEAVLAPVATFAARSDLIAIPLESNDPTITIIQIYPTTITHRRWQREAALQAALQTIPTNPSQMPSTPFQGG